MKPGAESGWAGAVAFGLWLWTRLAIAIGVGRGNHSLRARLDAALARGDRRSNGFS